jgi:hypothetical protein
VKLAKKTADSTQSHNDHKGKQKHFIDSCEHHFGEWLYVEKTPISLCLRGFV